MKTAKRAQQGAVLAMTLIMLFVVSLLAIWALKSAISGEQVARNMRSSIVATQSAESALRLCEEAVRRGASGIGGAAFVKLAIPDALPAGNYPSEWKTRSNWATGSTKFTLIPSGVIAESSTRPVPRPKCMAEQFRLPRLDPDSTLTDPYLITAIGYSSDYSETSGIGTSGSEVWIQSVIRP